MSNFMAQFDTVSNSEAGATLHFKTAKGELAYLDSDADCPSKPLTFTMLGSSSDKHNEWILGRHANERKKKKLVHGKKDKKEVSKDDLNEIVSLQVERLCAVGLSWTNIPDEKGKQLEYTEANAKLVFEKYQELRVQAINFLDSNVNFIPS